MKINRNYYNKTIRQGGFGGGGGGTPPPPKPPAPPSKDAAAKNVASEGSQKKAIGVDDTLLTGQLGKGNAQRKALLGE